MPTPSSPGISGAVHKDGDGGRGGRGAAGLRVAGGEGSRGLSQALPQNGRKTSARRAPGIPSPLRLCLSASNRMSEGQERGAEGVSSHMWVQQSLGDSGLDAE